MNESKIIIFRPLTAPVLRHTACRVYSSQSGPWTPVLCILRSPPRPSQESERESQLVKIRDSCISSPLSSITDKADWILGYASNALICYCLRGSTPALLDSSWKQVSCWDEIRCNFNDPCPKTSYLELKNLNQKQQYRTWQKQEVRAWIANTIRTAQWLQHVTRFCLCNQ